MKPDFIIRMLLVKLTLTRVNDLKHGLKDSLINDLKNDL